MKLTWETKRAVGAFIEIVETALQAARAILPEDHYLIDEVFDCQVKVSALKSKYNDY
jgi:hypothetical protein